MPNEIFIFEATAKSFPTIVVENSKKIPAIVEFMSVSSKPCFIVEGIFTSLAREFASKRDYYHLSSAC
ncbi:MAG: hypothetical protein KAJ19_00790 [Gammaproteobacteria bacterium]|nr:hypothetical protein [Gammaproteobacteria bacterium]